MMSLSESDQEVARMAERELLAAALASPESVLDLPVMAALDNVAAWRELGRYELWTLLRSRWAEGLPCDEASLTIAVAEGGTGRKLDELFSLTTLNGLPTSARHYAETVIEMADRRKLLTQLELWTDQAGHYPPEEVRRAIAGSVGKAITKPGLWSDLAPIGMEVITNAPAEREYLLRSCETKRVDGVQRVVDDAGLLPQGVVGLLVGEGGAGKSYAAIALGIAVATGRRWFDRFTTKPGRVLLAMGEESQEEVRRRLHETIQCLRLSDASKQMVARNLVAIGLAGQRDFGFMAEGGETGSSDMLRAQLLRERKESGEPWRLIIIDPMSRFAGLDTEKDNHAATKFIQIAESFMTPKLGNGDPDGGNDQSGRWGPTVLLTAHTSKAARQGGSVDVTATRGVTGLTDAVRWAASITYKHTYKQNKHHPALANLDGEYLRLTFTKNNYARWTPGIDLFRSRDGGGVIRPTRLDELKALGEAIDATRVVRGKVAMDPLRSSAPHFKGL